MSPEAAVNIFCRSDCRKLQQEQIITGQPSEFAAVLDLSAKIYSLPPLNFRPFQLKEIFLFALLSSLNSEAKYLYVKHHVTTNNNAEQEAIRRHWIFLNFLLSLQIILSPKFHPFRIGHSGELASKSTFFSEVF